MPKIGFRHSAKSRRRMSRTRRARLAAGAITVWNKGKKNGQVAWNKGLTKANDPRVAKYAKNMLGHAMSVARRRKMSEKAKARCASNPDQMKRVARIRLERQKITGNPQKGRTNHWFIGRKSPIFSATNYRYKHLKYGGSTFRSTWELAFARWCRKHKIPYQYEPKTFRLAPPPKGLHKGRAFTYTPDFYLPKQGVYVEISGYLPPEKIAKFQAFQKAYPKVPWYLLMKPALEAAGVL